MPNLHSLLRNIDGYKDEIIELQAGLTSRIALGPENNGTGEHEKAAYLQTIIEELKPDYIKEIRAPDKRARDGYRPNLVAKWKGKQPGPTIWVLSHMDIVPPGDHSLWATDPYEVKIDGDRIIGRGVEDNQHGMDLIIVPDGGNKDGSMIEVAEKSLLWLKFTVIGFQCHGSTPDKGKNSLYGMAKLVVALNDLKQAFGQRDDLFNPPTSTFESTKTEPNVPNINTIPGKNIFYMDCRILPHHQPDDILVQVEKITSDVAAELGLEIQVEQVYRQDATNPTPIDAPVVKALAKAIKTIKNLNTEQIGIGGGTVAAFFRRAGIPAAVWVTTQDTAHQPNEYCLLSDLISDAKIFASVYMDELNEEGN
ncbi:MAG: M20/M25/M40 family metallo-hydrolase [Deltaproteobacteria bacterium]|nr:M20/M25/M40 family metallo-hydrolase [Deltaproteobacteria bacterium]